MNFPSGKWELSMTKENKSLCLRVSVFIRNKPINYHLVNKEDTKGNNL